MHKIVCLRGRKGDGWYGQCRRANRTEDRLPSFEGMKAPYYDSTKYSDDYLGPMRRWLRSQVGRPWNDVYSEICRGIRADSRRRHDIRKQLMAMLTDHTFMRPAFFIHPEFKTLCIAPEVFRLPPVLRGPRAKFTSVQRWLPKDMLLLKLNGQWFICRMVGYSPKVEGTPFDVVFKSRLIETHAVEAYGAPFYCVRKRKLSQEELQARGLTNSNTSSDGFLAVIGESLRGRIRRSHGNPVQCWHGEKSVFRRQT